MLDAHVKDMQNMRMLEPLQQVCFLEKPLALLLRSQVGMQDFDCHGACFQMEVFGSIDAAKGAAVQLFDQAIVAKLLADIVVLLHHSCCTSSNC